MSLGEPCEGRVLSGIAGGCGGGCGALADQCHEPGGGAAGKREEAE